MDIYDHDDRLIEPGPAPTRRGPGFIWSAPSPAARPVPAIDSPVNTLSPAIGFEIEHPYEDDDDTEEDRAPVRVAPGYSEIHARDAHGQA